MTARLGGKMQGVGGRAREGVGGIRVGGGVVGGGVGGKE